MREQVVTSNVVANPKSRYGNARSATRHFIVQRLTGFSNILFLGLLLFVGVRLAGQDRTDMVALLGQWYVGLPFALLIAIACVHMRIGMREVVEDYVHEPRTHRLALSLNTFVVLLIGVVAVGSLVKLVFWG